MGILPDQPGGTSLDFDLLGDLFGITADGSIPGLIDRTQPNIESALKQREISESPGWLGANDAAYGGLLPGVALIPNILMNVAVSIIGLPFSMWPGDGPLGFIGEVPNILSDIGNFFGNLTGMFGDGVDFNDLLFDPVEAVFNFVDTMILPTGLLASLVDGFIPDLQIPGLDASKIISGIFDADKVQDLPGVLTALQGISLVNPGSVLDAIEAVPEAFAEALIALLGNVPIVGTYFQSYAAQLLATIHNAVDAISTATATQQIVASPPPTPTWEGLTAGLATFPLGLGGSETVTVTSATARMGFITPAQAAEFAGVTMFAKRTGTVTGVFMDIYKLDTAAGGLTRLWSSPDLTADVTTGATMVALQANFPEGLGLVSDLNDVFAVQVRMTGSGSVTVVAHTYPDTSALTGHYPTRPGVVRNATTAPDTISAATMAGIYTNVVPYAMLARYAQTSEGGPATPPVTMKTYYDGFNRNSSVNHIRLGSDWVSERNTSDFVWSPNAGYLSIREDKVQYGSGSNGAINAGREGALYRHQSGSDSVQLDLTFSIPKTTPSMGVICAASDWSGYFGVAVTVDEVEFRVGTAWATETVVASIPINFASSPGASEGNLTKLSITYNGATNIFSVFYTDNPSAPPILEWEDASNLVPHGDGHRYGGLVLQLTGSTQSSPVDDFRLADTAAGDAVDPPPTEQPTINRFIDFSTLSNGTISVPGWVGARSGAGASMPTVNAGAYVDANTGTVPAANYLTTRLTDNARIIWAIAGFKFGTSGASNSRANITLCETDFSYDPDASGFLQFNAGGDWGPVHVNWDNGGYLVQWIDTRIGGGPAHNVAYHTYAGGPMPAGALHNIGFAVDIATNTLSVLGADGIVSEFVNANFGGHVGNYAFFEIYDTNPSADQAVQFLYVGADSVIGGRGPEQAGAISTHTSPAKAALTGGVVTGSSGAIAATTPPAKASVTGGQAHAGTIAAKAAPAVAAASGTMHPSGTIAAKATPATAAATGGGITAGAIAATTAPAIAAATGAQAHSGTIAAKAAPATAAISGAQAHAGTIAAKTTPATAAISGAQAHAGTIAAKTAPAVAAASGSVSSGASFSDNFNRADGAIGNGWTNQLAVVLRILSNIATPDFASNYGIAKCPTAMNTAKHYAEVTINTANASDAYLLYVGAKTSAQAFAFIQPNTSIQIFTKTTGYGDLTGFTNRATASSATAANGDVFRFEVDNGVFTLKRNGTALTGCTNINLSAITGTDGRDVLLGVNTASSARGADAFAAADF